MVSDFFSSSLQDTEEDTPVISAASLVKSMAGNLVDFSRTIELQLLEKCESLSVYIVYTYEL